MQAALEPFLQAHADEVSWVVVAQLSPFAPPENPGRLYDFYRASNEHQIENEVRSALKYNRNSRLSNKEAGAWMEIFVAYWRAVGFILRAEEARNQGRIEDRQFVDIYDAWKTMTDLIVRHISNGSLPNWTIVCMYVTANHLRRFAIRADEQLAQSKSNVTFSPGFGDDIVSTVARNEKLEEAARVFNKMFALCLGDRNPDMRESRKWGTYYVANLLFKTYFKLKNVSLSKNVVRSIEAQNDLPDFKVYPAAHRTTYKYYVGVLAFLQEDYTKAESCLTDAWNMCLPDSMKNQELILTYLIPCRLITKHNIPTQTLLASYPGLKRIFGPLVSCIKSGDLAGFDAALLAGEDTFVKRRIYLTLERGRDIALRNLLRKTFLAEGFEDLKEGQSELDRIRKTRIPLSHFVVALRLRSSGQALEDDEVECLLANMIYKGLMKGYISREHSMVVLNKKGAFPGTGV
ncbi:hypothetical protein BU24DRAFT_420785 [Aaosphaeria arxii CBS 175.79]|uniref:Protein CSN12 homolog n=1 Tax=Aaosphaeria arxii CBS 175.79 TaxID=1450172 RepID=A0A6A5XWM0_9PLEO|nr:uncharacterized protein BU24DRAFT_420785 [Aaosphaeria arxii CBS 175.79]KAF2017735.1 hypothetical protein BU24DRAFT_420785 [Aaosphaeria arxii CBS 175.79]